MSNLKPRPRMGLMDYPPFESEYVREVVRASPTIFQLHVSPLAKKNFKNVEILATISTQNNLVRNALVAYVAMGDYIASGEKVGTEVLALRHYQRCIVELRQQSVFETDIAVIVVLLLAAVEASSTPCPYNFKLTSLDCQAC